MGLWRRKRGRLFWSVPRSRRWRATSCLKTVRAGRADGSESNYREQGDPAGLATPTILFDEAEVLPCRYINVERDCFRDILYESNYVWLCLRLCHAHMQAHKKKCRHRGRGWEKTEVGFLYMPQCSFTHCGALLPLQTGGQEIFCLHISHGSASCELSALVLIKCYIYGMGSSTEWACWVSRLSSCRN